MFFSNYHDRYIIQISGSRDHDPVIKCLWQPTNVPCSWTLCDNLKGGLCELRRQTPGQWDRFIVMGLYIHSMIIVRFRLPCTINRWTSIIQPAIIGTIRYEPQVWISLNFTWILANLLVESLYVYSVSKYRKTIWSSVEKCSKCEKWISTLRKFTGNIYSYVEMKRILIFGFEKIFNFRVSFFFLFTATDI